MKKPWTHEEDSHKQLHDIDSTDDHNGVSGATENNFASFNANGLPKDSGSNSSSFDSAGAATSAVSTHESTYDHVDLTDGGDTTLHYHASDRARANHTGTQASSTISDFDTEVSNNTDVTANTSKVTNATHTGEITGSTALTAHSSLISNKFVKTPVAGDFLLVADASDSGVLKKVDADNFLSGGSGDILAELVESEVSIAAATSLTSTAFGKMHVCSGTSYAVDLPGPATHTGEWVGFYFTASGIIEIARNASETINGISKSRLYVAGEMARYFCDGTNWFAEQQLREVSFCAYSSAVQECDYATHTLREIDTEVSDIGGYYNDSTYRFVPLVPGHYLVGYFDTLVGLTDGKMIILSIRRHAATDTRYEVGRAADAGLSGNMSSGATVSIYLDGVDDYVDVTAYNNTVGGADSYVGIIKNRFWASRIDNLTD